jgi:anti-sigma B factor antagonist
MRDARYPVTMAGGIPVVVAPEEIDITNAGGLSATLLDLATQGHAAIVIDMTRTQFCDTAGLQVLVGAHRRALAGGHEVRAAISGGSVSRILAITGIDRVIPQFTSVDDALSAPVSGLGDHRRGS